MKMVRWGICVLSVGAMFAFSGCAATFGRWQSPSAYDEEMVLRHLNEQQASVNTGLINEKVRLEAENAALTTQLGIQGELIAANKKIMDSMQAKLDEINRNVPAGESPDIGQHMNKYGEVVLDIKGDVLFASGQSKLKTSGEKILKQAADMVRDKPNKLAICGFTDSDPIQRSKWASNFDLSGARALAVLDFLEKEGIKADRLHYRGYGQYALISDAAGKENKAKSRRAEIVLLNDMDVLSVAPVKAAPKPPKPPVPMTPK